MEVSASRRRGVRTPIIACRGLRSEERRHYRSAMAGEKSGPTVHDLSANPRRLHVSSGSVTEAPACPRRRQLSSKAAMPGFGRAAEWCALDWWAEASRSPAAARAGAGASIARTRGAIREQQIEERSRIGRARRSCPITRVPFEACSRMAECRSLLPGCQIPVALAIRTGRRVRRTHLASGTLRNPRATGAAASPLPTATAPLARPLPSAAPDAGDAGCSIHLLRNSPQTS
jgi:hypothetical protein